MLVLLPFDRELDWKKPPVVTLALIAINCFIFFGLQSGDTRREMEAFRFYHDSALPAIEFPLYRSYLKQHGELDKLDEFNKLADPAAKPSDYRALYLPMMLEVEYGFITRLKAEQLIKPGDPDFDKWRRDRAAFEKLLDRSTTDTYSLRPARWSVVTLFTAMFLHGGIMHLVGNMVFLFIVGFVVETVMGARIYLGLYLLAGLAAGVVDILLGPHDLGFHLGASGAIAGVMGAYAMLFGLRRINFFFNFLFYFNRVRAPAILMLPLWLGDQALGLLDDKRSGINYMAHIVGLSVGGLLTFGLKRFTHLLDLEYMDQPEKDQARADSLARGMQLIAELKPREAMRILKALLKETPDDPQIMHQLYNASKLEPGSDDYHHYAKRLLLDENTSARERHALFVEYNRLAKPKPRLGVDDALWLAKRFLNSGYADEGERLTLAVFKGARNHAALPSMLLELAKRASGERATRYFKAILTHYPQSDEAKRARGLLQLVRSAPPDS